MSLIIRKIIWRVRSEGFRGNILMHFLLLIFLILWWDWGFAWEHVVWCSLKV